MSEPSLPYWILIPWSDFFFFFFKFIFGCVGSSFLCEGFLQSRQAGATPHRGARASHHHGLSCCGAQAPDAQAQQLWLTGPAAPRHAGSSQTRARTRVPCIGRQILNHCATREARSDFLKHRIFKHLRVINSITAQQYRILQKTVSACFEDVISSIRTLHGKWCRDSKKIKILKSIKHIYFTTAPKEVASVCGHNWPSQRFPQILPWKYPFHKGIKIINIYYKWFLICRKSW